MDKFINKDGKVILEIDDEGNEKADAKHFKDLAGKKKVEEKSPDKETDTFTDEDDGDTGPGTKEK